MIKCTVCGYDNKDEAQYCLNCGSPLSHEKVSEAIDDVSEEQTVMLDPRAMQRRIQEEMEKEKAKSSGHVPKPGDVPPVASVPPATQPAPQPTSDAPKAPASSPTPSSGPMTSGPSAGSSSTSGIGLPAAGTDEKPWLITFLLAFFFGYLGAHRFYVGKIGTGALMLVTLGACGIWQLVDVLMIIMGKFRDAQGRELAK